MNIVEILKLKFKSANFLGDIVLQDDGEGAYIKEWNLVDPIPTKEDLVKWGGELDLEYRQLLAVSQRVYPPIKDQLDMLYHDKVNNTNLWAETIAAVKLEHPKPTE